MVLTKAAEVYSAKLVEVIANKINELFSHCLCTLDVYLMALLNF